MTGFGTIETCEGTCRSPAAKVVSPRRDMVNALLTAAALLVLFN
jgi:hypothetical protein